MVGCNWVGTTSTGTAPFEGTPLIIRLPTPDTVLLAGLDRPVQAGLGDFTATADSSCFSIWSSVGPVFPTGKNSSGSSPRQAARSRAATSVLPTTKV